MLKVMVDPEEGVKVVCVLPGTVKSNLLVFSLPLFSILPSDAHPDLSTRMSRWEDRDDHVMEATRYAERKLMPPRTIAEMIFRMVRNTIMENSPPSPPPSFPVVRSALLTLLYLYL